MMKSRTNLVSEVREMLRDVKEILLFGGAVSGVDLVFDGEDFEICVSHKGMMFDRSANYIVTDITDETIYSIRNSDTDYLVDFIEREMEDTLFFLEEVAEEV